LAKPLILVAEDDEKLLSALVESLEKEGFEANGAPNGAAVLKKIRGDGRRPDLLLLDLEMPVLSGWEFLELRRRDPVLLLIPVIVLSGETDIPPQIHADAFLRKPFEFAVLREMVQRILEKSATDPERLPRQSEPWSIDLESPTVVRNSFDEVVANVRSAGEARRLVAAVNGTSRISTPALEQGIIDRGLECLYELNRYDTDQEYRKEVDCSGGFASVVRRRSEIAAVLGASLFGLPRPA
jgi:DNA-binding response OmpR family regulator